MDRDRIEPWEKLDEEEGAEYAMFRVRHARFRSPRDGAEQRYDIADSPSGAAALAITPASELVLVEQYRPPLERSFLELPSGIVDEGEDMVEAAVRELEEETGYRGDPPRILGTTAINPSWQTTRVGIVLVTGAHRAAPKNLDRGEDTRVHLVPMAELSQRMDRGELEAGLLLAALAMLHLKNGGLG